MGAQLAAFFEQAKARAGIQGAVKLAMITRMSKVAAENAPDSPDNIRLFREALGNI